MCNHSETGINWYNEEFCLECGEIIERKRHEIRVYNLRSFISGIRNAFRRRMPSMR